MGYKKGRLQKRWYIDATVGKNVPIIGGTGLKMGTGTLTKRGLDQHIKQVVKRSVLEPKMWRSTLQTSPTLVHNSLYTYNLFRGIVNGTDEENRIGDTISVKSQVLKIQLYGATAGTTDKISFRVMVVKSKVANSSSGIISAHLGTTDIFWDSPAELLNAPVCYNQCSVLYDQIHSMQPAFSGQRIDKVVNITLKNPTKFQYSEQSSLLGKYYNYYLVIIPHQSRAVTGLTAVGDATLQHCVSFVDSR